MDVHNLPDRSTALQQHGLGAEHGHRLAVFLQVQLAFARHPGEVTAGVGTAAHELLVRGLQEGSISLGVTAQVLHGRSLGAATFQDQHLGIEFLAGFGEIAR